jgi:Protein kinase domain
MKSCLPLVQVGLVWFTAPRIRQDGTDFLVMEYLEGETLAQRLVKGPLPLEQVLQYAIEIADALDKAHRKGVTHRDLKPGNVMLTKSGTKLLDFGLAKLRQDASPATPLSQLPTAKDAITAQGTILGTLQYMAPEQLEGKEADARTDIFAFGAVVYEMATGKRAFEGKSQASVIAAILEREPPAMSSLQPMTPPALDRIVKKCLRKDPDERWQSARDVTDELKWIAEGSSQTGLQAPVVLRAGPSHRWWIAAIAAALVLTALGGWMVSRFRQPAADASVLRVSINPPEGGAFFFGNNLGGVAPFPRWQDSRVWRDRERGDGALGAAAGRHGCTHAARNGWCFLPLLVAGQQVHWILYDDQIAAHRPRGWHAPDDLRCDRWPWRRLDQRRADHLWSSWHRSVPRASLGGCALAADHRGCVAR